MKCIPLALDLIILFEASTIIYEYFLILFSSINFYKISIKLTKYLSLFFFF